MTKILPQKNKEDIAKRPVDQGGVNIRKNEEKLNKLRQDEIDITKRINALKDKEIEQKEKTEEEISRLDDLLNDRKKTVQIYIDNFFVQILSSKLIEELGVLVNKYKELVSKFDSKDEEIKKEKEQLSAERQNLVHISFKLDERKDEIEAKELDLNNREIIIKKSESFITEQNKSIADRWVKFYNDVEKSNVYFSTKEKEILKSLEEISKEKKINTNERKANEEESERLKKQDELVKDKFLELERSQNSLKNVIPCQTQ